MLIIVMSLDVVVINVWKLEVKSYEKKNTFFFLFIYNYLISES